MSQTTELSEEATTSTPTINPIKKSLSITIDSDNNLNLNAHGTWSLHEMLGSLVLVGIDTYSNNRKSDLISDKLDFIINAVSAENNGMQFKDVADKLIECANSLKSLNG